MEVADEIIQTQVTKFQKITCNGAIQDSCSLNPKKLATQKGNHHHHHSGFQTQTQIQNQNLNQTQNRNLNFPVGNGGGGCGGGRICGWPASRIVRVSRASGGKDRHSKVLTSKGLRDRRIRLSVTTAIDFYDLQDRLGYDQPSKAVEWLIKAAESSISELPSLDPSFSGEYHHHDHHRKTAGNEQSKSGSSTSETSKGSGSGSMISRSENRIRARERAREMAAKRVNTVNGSSFTDLLTGVNGVSSSNQSPEARIHWSSPVDNSFQTMQQFNISGTGENVNQRFSFFQENLTPVSGGGDHRGESYSLNFQIPPSPASKLALSRGTLQSNVLSSSPHHHHHHHYQRSLQFQPSLMADGSVTTNFPFFMAPTIATGAPDHFLATGYVDSQRLQLYGGGDDGIRHSDHHHHHYKEKSKN